MSAKTYWNLLVLVGFLCQGIIGTFAEKDIDESSELLVRQKRVISRAENGDIKENIRNTPYIVIVKRLRNSNSCVGTILSNHIVLTLAQCVTLDKEIYRVYSGSARRATNGPTGLPHAIREKIERISDQPRRPREGIALITVDPPFGYSANTHNIKLYEGPIYPGLYGTVSGWGCDSRENPGTAHPNHLRTIVVPIIRNDHCAAMYAHTFPIFDSDICTHDPTGLRYCGDIDMGAPFVTAGNGALKLVGIFLSNERDLNRSKPDVFINLQNRRYKNWIVQNIHNT